MSIWFDDIENENANDIVLEGDEQVTIVASSAVVDPVIKRWVPPETKVVVAQMSVELAERLRQMIGNNDYYDDDDYRSIDTGMSLLVSKQNSDIYDEQDDVVDEESGLDEDFKVGLSLLNESGLDEEDGPIILNGDGIMRNPDVIVGTDRKNRRLKTRRCRIVIAIILLFFIAVGTFIGVAAWLGI